MIAQIKCNFNITYFNIRTPYHVVSDDATGANSSNESFAPESLPTRRLERTIKCVLRVTSVCRERSDFMMSAMNSLTII